MKAAKSLTVEYLERVFMKNKYRYKAVVYQDRLSKVGFWTDRAIDKQHNNPGNPVSDYWISDFLLSDLIITPATGTKRLAAAFREAAKSSPFEIRQEIVAAATLCPGLGKKKVTVNEVMKQFSLSDEAKQAALGQFKSPQLADERFEFDQNEFRRVIGFRSLELDNGAVLTAPTEKFDRVFERSPVDGADGQELFSTIGKVVNARLKVNA
jgi:hypothetical protein